MSINVNDKNLGHATAYAYYKAGGGTMTEAEFTEFMADFGAASQTAVEAAQAALASETAAQTAATTATNKASEATTAAQTATTKAAEAQADADAAALDASQALSAASTATTKATEATTAAATATSAASTATTAKDDAVSAKTAAQTAQTGAETAAASVQSSAAQIATNTDDIAQLKNTLPDKADQTDMLKAFPTDTASGSVASFNDGANVPVKSLIVNIDPVQSGSGDPSPTNVRPISGWSEVNVEHTGANVWDEEWEVGGLTWAGGEPYSASDRIRAKNFSPCKPNTSYYAVTNFAVFFYDETKTFISYRGFPTGGVEVTTPSNARFFKVMKEGTTTYGNNISINYPSTDRDYHPYSGQSINIQLGQTVYGGKLDVTKGELVIDRAMVDLGALNWTYSENTGYFNADVSINVPTKTQWEYQTGQCSRYKVERMFYIINAENRIDNCIAWYLNAIRVTDSAYTDATAFKTAVTGQTLVYELATPITVQLTPHEVTALLGSNNVLADSGDSEVVYRADPTLYIQRLTEPDADMVADSNITSGQYFMVGNTLYKATANIASGATISPNVNCTRKSLSEALNELNA